MDLGAAVRCALTAPADSGDVARAAFLQSAATSSSSSQGPGQLHHDAARSAFLRSVRPSASSQTPVKGGLSFSNAALERVSNMMCFGRAAVLYTVSIRFSL